MNEVKKSLRAIVGDVSKEKEELKQSIRTPLKKPRRKSRFPLLASAIVSVAILLFALNVYQHNMANTNEENYVINETLYDLQFTTEARGNPTKEDKYLILINTLRTASVIDYAKSLGYVENMEEIDKHVKEAEQTFYGSMTSEQKEEMDKQQLENFGITYEEYFNHIQRETFRYSNALEWLQKNQPAEIKTQRELIDAFIAKHTKSITAFKEKKQIPPSIHPSLLHAEFIGIVAEINENKILLVAGVTREEIKDKPVSEIINNSYDAAWFSINSGMKQIEQYETIRLTYDPLSSPVLNTVPTHFKTVLEWDPIEQ